MSESNLDHPCKDTCSGWKQGFERGEKKWRELAEELAEALRKIYVETSDYTRNLSFSSTCNHLTLTSNPPQNGCKYLSYVIAEGAIQKYEQAVKGK